ncbi:hypothetical protein MN116_007558 [Schistosoma mekongi]|uniref:Uncharacterized protein n=1 Tax=Schistosoma mekongi TaxID=38744 RepID=A0AAE1Z8D1_SCHME|nr:hypothetical protein MN116_007558 [Schistosoma mekongi]
MNEKDSDDDINWETIHNDIYELLCSVNSTQEIQYSIKNLFKKFLLSKSNKSIIIHQLLLSIFNPSINNVNNNDNECNDLDYLHILDDAFNHNHNKDIMHKTISNEQDHNLFIGILLIARQLCSEDCRLTGINYKQWWMETFFNSLHNNHFLLTRYTIFYFCYLLIELLPLEKNIKFLQIQLNTQPNWFNTRYKKSILSSRRYIKSSTHEIYLKHNEITMNSFNENNDINDDLVIMPIDLECIDTTDTMTTTDYIESCINRWNDYCEIAQGRLAELREHYSATKITLTKKVTPECSTVCTTLTTPGWSDVLNWLNEIASQHTTDNYGNDISTGRLPSDWNEANLFRPRWLRSTLIPALLNAPEIENLSTELKFAREQLLNGIRSAGLSHLLDHTDKTTIKSVKARITTTTTKKRSTNTKNKSSSSKRSRLSNNEVDSSTKQSKIGAKTINMKRN